MKHVFCVHSHITYLASLGIIDFLKLNKDEIIVISTNYDCPSGKIRIWNINPYKGNIIQKIHHRIKHFNFGRFLDNFINKKVDNDNFIAYLPDMSLIGKLLVTNPKCKGFNFFEEGTASYIKYDNLDTLSYFFLDSPWRTRLLVFNDLRSIFRDILFILKGYNLKIFTLPRPANCYTSFKNIKFFGFSEAVFPNSLKSNKIILSFSNSKKYFSAVRNYNTLNNGYIWIGDDLATFGGKYTSSQYINAITNSIIRDGLNNKISTIHIKFHHFDTGKFNNDILEYIKSKGFNIVIIPKSVCLEIELLYVENVRVYGIDSSLLYYASLIGHQSFAAYKLLNCSYEHNTDNDEFYEKRVTILGQ